MRPPENCKTTASGYALCLDLQKIYFRKNVFKQIFHCERIYSAPINSRFNVVVRSPAPIGLGRNGCWPSRGSQLPRALPFIFSLCCPLNDHRRAAHSIFKIGRLFSLFPFHFSCPSLSLPRLLILLLFLMSGNVHPNPGPIFPCSVCAGNVTWRGKSVQCCAWSKWVHLRCSQLSLSQFRALKSSHSWSCPPCRITVSPFSDFPDMYTSTVQSSPASANAALSLHPRLQTSYSPSADSISSPSAPPPLSLAHGFSSAPPASTPPWLSQGSSIKCWRSSSQEHWTTSLSFVPSCRPYLHSGIQS